MRVVPDSGRRRLSIGTWVAGVSLLALLPMLAFAAASLYREVLARQQEGTLALERRAVGAAASVGHELARVFAVLSAMAESDGMRSGDLAAAHAFAQRIVAQDPGIQSISLSQASGHQPFTTLLPFGAPVPPSNAVALQRPVFEGRQRVVLPLVTGAVTKRPVVIVAMPVTLGPSGLHALRAVVRLEAIDQRLNETIWPEDWTASLVDQNRVIVARSRDAARFTGQTATASLQDGLRSGQALFYATTKDGVQTVVSAAPVPGSGWFVVVGRPLEALNAQVRNSMAAVLAAGLACSALAIGGALFVARWLSHQLRGVVESHRDAAEHAPVDTTISEVADLSEALGLARAAQAQTLQELQSAKNSLSDQLKERSEMLDVMAHEVRQPLNNASAAIQAASVAIVDSGLLSIAQPLDRAEKVLREVQASIDNTLAVAALLAGAERIGREDTDIDALIAVTIADMPAVMAPRVKVQRGTATRTAAMDPNLMRLALRNLLSNALKYSPTDAPVVLRVSDCDEPLALLLEVEDRGWGIGAERLPRLFSRGTDVGPAGRRQGLGLYIVQRVMELHGGQVQLVRTGLAGTVMRLIVPQGDEE